MHLKFWYHLHPHALVAQWIEHQLAELRVGGSNPLERAIFHLYVPDRSVTQRSGHIGYTLSASKGFSRGCKLFSSRSMYPRSYSIKDTSQTLSSTSLMPNF